MNLSNTASQQLASTTTTTTHNLSNPSIFSRLTIPQRIVKTILPFIPKAIRIWIYNLLEKSHYGTIIPSVFRLPLGLVLKISYPHSIEPHALQFVNSLNIVHTPILIDFLRTSENSYMLSTWIEGERLGDVWDDDMTIRDKEQVTLELYQQFSILRSLTTSKTHPICNAGGGPIDDPRIPWVAREDPRIFYSGPDFAKEVWTGLDAPRNRDTLRPLVLPLIEREDVRVVFSHGDLIFRNLIIPGGLSRWRSGSKPIGIVDWEYAGWMPVYWDALKATWLDCEEDSEWIKVMRKVFPECNVELDVDWEWRCRSQVAIL